MVFVDKQSCTFIAQILRKLIDKIRSHKNAKPVRKIEYHDKIIFVRINQIFLRIYALQ